MPQTVQTLVEIHHQPAVWKTALDYLSSLNLQELLKGKEPGKVEWVFVGCGTSYYLAQAAAMSLTSLLDTPARAVPASEILLQPQLVFPGEGTKYFPVLISRSGHTSEVLQAAEYLQSKGLEFLAVTCDGRELEQASTRTLRLPVVEHSTVMTSSFTTMLMALQYIAATFAGKQDVLDAFRALPEYVEALIAKYAPQVESFAKKPFEDIAILGQGVFYAIASEAALKVMESSSTYAQYFHTLEFRHGPKSIAGEGTLIGALISDFGYNSEVPVLREMKELGATTMAVVNVATDELREATDLLIELNLPTPEIARPIAYILWGQLLGSHRGLEKGLDPDNPRNLSRVVTI